MKHTNNDHVCNLRLCYLEASMRGGCNSVAALRELRLGPAVAAATVRH